MRRVSLSVKPSLSMGYKNLLCDFNKKNMGQEVSHLELIF